MTVSLRVLVRAATAAGPLLLAACGSREPAPPSSGTEHVALAPEAPAGPDLAALAAIADSIRLAYQAAVNAGDAGALAGLYAPDAIVIDPDVEITEGRDAIRAAFEASFAGAEFSNMNIVQAELVPMGDYLLTLGTSTVTVRPRGGRATQERNRWMAVTRRQADGSWRLWRVQSSNAATLRRE